MYIDNLSSYLIAIPYICISIDNIYYVNGYGQYIIARISPFIFIKNVRTPSALYLSYCGSIDWWFETILACGSLGIPQVDDSLLRTLNRYHIWSDVQMYGRKSPTRVYGSYFGKKGRWTFSLYDTAGIRFDVSLTTYEIVKSASAPSRRLEVKKKNALINDIELIGLGCVTNVVRRVLFTIRFSLIIDQIQIICLHRINIKPCTYAYVTSPYGSPRFRTPT